MKFLPSASVNLGSTTPPITSSFWHTTGSFTVDYNDKFSAVIIEFPF
jgi:hypothetical protein